VRFRAHERNTYADEHGDSENTSNECVSHDDKGCLELQLLSEGKRQVEVGRERGSKQGRNTGRSRRAGGQMLAHTRGVCAILYARTLLVVRQPFPGPRNRKLSVLSLSKMRGSAVAIEVLKFATPHSSPESAEVLKPESKRTGGVFLVISRRYQWHLTFQCLPRPKPSTPSVELLANRGLTLSTKALRDFVSARL
jgi:hypothetical protein